MNILFIVKEEIPPSNRSYMPMILLIIELKLDNDCLVSSPNSL